jgi:hypothetical protein
MITNDNIFAEFLRAFFHPLGCMMVHGLVHGCVRKRGCLDDNKMITK